MRATDSATGATTLNYFPGRVQSALKAYASEMDLSPDAVVQLAISYFLESADIDVDMDDQDSPDVPSKQSVLALLPFSLQKGIEQYAIEYEFSPEFIVEMAVTFLLDPDASSFEDCQAIVQKDQVGLLQQYREAHQPKAA